MIRLVILHHEVSGMFIYVVVGGTNEEHTCSCTISLHHIALHIIRGCRRLMVATVPVQHHTLPEEGYNAASYLVGYGGSGHGIWIALHSLWFIIVMKVYMRFSLFCSEVHKCLWFFIYLI